QTLQGPGPSKSCTPTTREGPARPHARHRDQSAFRDPWPRSAPAMNLRNRLRKLESLQGEHSPEAYIAAHRAWKEGREVPASPVLRDYVYRLEQFLIRTSHVSMAGICEDEEVEAKLRELDLAFGEVSAS